MRWKSRDHFDELDSDFPCQGFGKSIGWPNHLCGFVVHILPTHPTRYIHPILLIPLWTLEGRIIRQNELLLNHWKILRPLGQNAQLTEFLSHLFSVQSKIGSPENFRCEFEHKAKLEETWQAPFGSIQAGPLESNSLVSKGGAGGGQVGSSSLAGSLSRAGMLDESCSNSHRQTLWTQILLISFKWLWQHPLCWNSPLKWSPLSLKGEQGQNGQEVKSLGSSLCHLWLHDC